MRRRYLFAYDVADDARRTDIFQALRDHGDHAQYSVFFCELTDRELIDLRSELDGYLNHAQDQLMILDLGIASTSLSERLDVLGKPYRPPGRCQVV
ncbi:MAG: CRISPR-associated endonuclease Cas2 [Planctomycetes bacterium]|nr:CRISPR-associated endonuclease Cas2 [Planctomycetota bacterium]